jgi:4-hydroxy 2-oxovalerate aldolase
MEKAIALLDCTLRDGGYSNDWDFGEKEVSSIVTAIDSVGTDYIELGFLEDNISFTPGRTKFSSLIEAESYMKEGMQVKPLCMIRHGDFSVESLPNKKEGAIQFIRYSFATGDFAEALPAIDMLINKGYEVFVQPVNTKHYNVGQITKMIAKLPKHGVKGFSIVDTLGNLIPAECASLIKLLDKELLPEVAIGLHLHDNFSLSLANALEAMSQNISRPIVIDTCITGLGRGAGNLRMEALLCALNDTEEGARYDLDPLLDIIDTAFPQQRRELIYLLSAAQNCHPSYGSRLAKEGNLTLKSILRIMKSIPETARSRFNKDILENIQKNNVELLEFFKKPRRLKEGEKKENEH